MNNLKEYLFLAVFLSPLAATLVAAKHKVQSNASQIKRPEQAILADSFHIPKTISEGAQVILKSRSHSSRNEGAHYDGNDVTLDIYEDMWHVWQGNYHTNQIN